VRKSILILASLTMLAAACGEEASPPADDGTGESPSQQAAAECTAGHADDLFQPETLTVGTDFDFMFPPWIIDRDPESGEGFESAITYEIAERMGFADSQVDWVRVPFNSSFAPGPKDFDFDVNNISVTEERDRAVDFSDSYYELTQALMVLEGSPIADATTMNEIKDSVFGAQIGTTSLAFINTVIQPTQDAKVYESTGDAKTALRNGAVDGLVLDLPTAYFEATVNTPKGVLVGQFPRTGEHLGLLFEEGNPLVECVNLALAEMTEDGTLEDLQNEWLADYLAVPTIQ
jgi:polar amino acid transport system substrate-binding protein